MIDRDKYSLRKPTDAMKKILKENLLESDLPFTLLIEQVPGTLSEESVRKDLIEYVSREYNIYPNEISRIHYFTDIALYRVVFQSTEECKHLANKEVKIRDRNYVLYRPPIPIPISSKSFKPKRSRRSTSHSQESTSYSHKRQKAIDEDYDESSLSGLREMSVESDEEESFSTSSSEKEEVSTETDESKSTNRASDKTSEASPDKKQDQPVRRRGRPKGTTKEFLATRQKTEPSSPKQRVPKNSLKGDQEYIVESILDKKSINGKVKYLFKLQDEKHPIKVWLFDEDIWKVIDMNRKHGVEKKEVETIPLEDYPTVDKILGADKRQDQLYLYVKWSNSDITSMIPSHIVNKLCPEKVIQFYEEKVVLDG